MKAILLPLTLGLLLTSAAGAVTLEFDLPKGIDAHRCSIQVQYRDQTLRVENLIPRPGAANEVTNLRPEKNRKEIVFKMPSRFPHAIGAVSRCLSLHAKEDFVFMSEKTAEERMLKLENGKYLDLCWQHGTGVRDPRREKSEGHIFVYIAERTVVNDDPIGKRLSLVTGDVRKEDRVAVEGVGSQSKQVAGIGELSVKCDYHVLSDEERETTKDELLGQFKGLLSNPQTPPWEQLKGVKKSGHEVKKSPSAQDATKPYEEQNAASAY